MTRSRLSYTILGIVLLGLVIGGLSLNRTTSEWMQQRIRDAFAVPADWVSSAMDFQKNVGESLSTLEEVKAKLEELKTKNAKLEMEQDIQRKLEDENKRLREMLGYKQAAAPQLEPARVVSRDPSSWWNTVQLNLGWVDNMNEDGTSEIVADLPVVTPRGVVGKTGVVSRHTTEVILLVDENCQISAKIDGSNAQGIVVGEGSIQTGQPLVRMRYIDRNAKINVGERVFTSGLGGVFPAGLLIGTIVEVPPLSNEVNFGLYREAVIKPNVDLSQLNEVFIITGTRAAPVAASDSEN